MSATARAIFLLSVFTLTVVLPFGCGPKRPKTVQVTGKVTYKGQPLEGARVMFHTQGGPPATGTTDKEGRFRLETFSTEDGALIGEHTVIISKYVPVPNGAASSSGAPDDMRGPGPPRIRQLVPARYTTPATSPLKAKVTAEGPNDFTFDLTD
ncbi:MAG TPA: carboxypeptidase-like regulatory domain-containing protein [Thermoguttaceae bacterium]|nr:carboxypeptidase-like regulatory domain-containing protein [Thermoguttaceae bacterium]